MSSWTKEEPTIDGLYWICCKYINKKYDWNKDILTVVEVSIGTDRIFVDWIGFEQGNGESPSQEYETYWLGPIEQPVPPKGI